jgi:tetratricopeptide (TPR) repeat protein
MKLRSRYWPVPLFFLVMLIGVGTAQEDHKALIDGIYALTKSAQTVEDFTGIVEQCEQALQKELSPALNKYAAQLQAWALNRRGESYVELAAQVLAAGKKEEAAKLDGSALADFEAAIKVDPQRWKALHNRGVTLALAHNYEAAVADFTRVVELKPDYPNAWFNRAEIRFEQADYAGAVEDYSKTLELQPRDLGALLGRGNAYLRQQQLEAAIASYSQAIEVSPSNAEAFANRGDAHQAARHWELAAQDYRQAIDLNPKSGRGYTSAAWLMATCPEERFRDAELALQAGRRAVELGTGENYTAVDALAAAYANAGQYDAAVKTLAPVIPQAPAKLREILQMRLALYESGAPFRQESSPPVEN